MKVTTSISIEKDTNKKLSVLLILLAIGLALLLFILVITGRLDKFTFHVLGREFEIACVLLGIWLTSIMFWWARQQGKFDLFEYPNWISLNVYIQVIFNVWMFQRERLPSIPWLINKYSSIMPITVFLYGFGLTAIWISYIFAFRKFSKIKVFSTTNSQRMRSGNVVIVWIVSWLILILVGLTGVNAYLGSLIGRFMIFLNYIQFIDIVFCAATAILIIHIFRKPTLSGWIWFSLLLSTEIAISLIIGSKSFALTFILVIISIYYAIDRMPKKLIILGLATIIFIVPIINNYRVGLNQANFGQGVSLNNRLNILSNAMVEEYSQPLSGTLDSTLETFKERQGSLFDISASVITLHPRSLPYVGFDMVYYLSTQVIPRLIWPTKPTTRPSLLLITSTYGGRTDDDTFTAIGLFADSYRAAGWLFLLAWFSLMGVFTAWLYVRGPFSKNTIGTVFYIVLITQILRYDFSITTVILSIIQFSILLWLMLIYIMFNTSSLDKSITPDIRSG